MFKFLICSCNADEMAMDMPTLTDAPKGLLRACMCHISIRTCRGPNTGVPNEVELITIER